MSWRRTLDLSDLFHADMAWEAKRDAMVARIRAVEPIALTVQDIADGLEESTDGDEWDQWWDEFYDWADANRVWVKTR